MQRFLSIPASVFVNRRGGTDQPRFLTYLVTFACNARCVMCDSWKKPTAGELSADELRLLLKKLPRMDAVRMSGGEPFVRRDFPELARVVSEELTPAVLHVTTNGFLTERIVAFVRERDTKIPLRILLSVDGYGAKHNEVRGQEHAWSRTQATLDALLPLRESRNFTLDVNQTLVDREGMEHYRRLRDELSPRGVRVQVVFAYGESATYAVDDELELEPKLGQYETFGDFSRQELSAFFHELLADVAGYPLPERWAKTYYLRGLSSRLLAGEAGLNPPCVALSSHLRLYPDGTVPTCQMSSKRAGDLKTETLAGMRASERFQAQRSWVKNCAGCWAECEILPSAFYTADLFRVLGPGKISSPSKRSDPRAKEGRAHANPAEANPAEANPAEGNPAEPSSGGKIAPEKSARHLPLL
jgi:Fe-coproporphyrin III synthase